MLNLPNNIGKNERVVRGAIGALLLIGGILGFGPMFMLIVGILLIAEAALSYCAIIDGINRFGQKKSVAPSSTTSSSTTTTPPPSSSGSSSNSSTTPPTSPSDKEPKA